MTQLCVLLSLKNLSAGRKIAQKVTDNTLLTRYEVKLILSFEYFLTYLMHQNNYIFNKMLLVLAIYNQNLSRAGTCRRF